MPLKVRFLCHSEMWVMVEMLGYGSSGNICIIFNSDYGRSDRTDSRDTVASKTKLENLDNTG